jgi:hypothetical protein
MHVHLTHGHLTHGYLTTLRYLNGTSSSSFYFPTKTFFSHLMSVTTTDTTSSAPNSASVLQSLLEDQQRRATAPSRTDDLRTLTEKNLRAANLQMPTQVSIFSTECLENPLLFPMLIAENKGMAVLAIQQYISSNFTGCPPHIISQTHELVLALSFATAIQASATGVSHYDMWQLTTPITKVLCSLLTFLQAKKTCATLKLSSQSSQQLMTTTRGMMSPSKVLAEGVKLQASQGKSKRQREDGKKKSYDSD